MSVPTIEIVRGSPSPQDNEAVLAAVISVWRATSALGRSGGDPWARAARLEGLGGAEHHDRLRSGER